MFLMGRITKYICSACVCSLLAITMINPQSSSAFTNQVIQRGAVGEDVIELQSRLQYIGFYNGKIDGVFGWSTYWALRNFQYEFGIKKVDGLAGAQTKQKLADVTKYYEYHVKTELKKGNKFTHYGGVPIDKQKGSSAKSSQNNVQKNAKSQSKSQQQQPTGQQSRGQQQSEGRNNNQATPQQNQTNKAATNGGSEQQPTGQQSRGQQQSEGRNNNQATPQQNQTNKAATNGGSEQQPTGQQSRGQQQSEGRNNNQATPQQNQTNKAATNGGSEQQQEKAQKPTALNVPNGFSQNDIQLMANAVYGEARGEPYNGQVAVAAVILNRVNSPAFPNTVAGVIFEPRAFTAVADGQIWLEPDETAKKAVLDAINGWDPTGNAMYYFNPDTATSAWIWSRPQIKQIGKHIFCN
ncbi:spore cortex-lytic enzyme [Priestia flexa]|uniref:spore cortex-lytic enzyme n=1 Tax=Priestia flexa TaxID=86664 RepID=UPI000C239CB5|nr:spore cortex-lytic enzyme [Priestia flexa]MEC0665908.1 spore cortex-lytic enzyme [Priestia flexa]